MGKDWNCYFVSFYWYNSDGQSGFGNGEIFLDREINMIENILVIEEQIKMASQYDIVKITNYQLLGKYGPEDQNG